MAAIDERVKGLRQAATITSPSPLPFLSWPPASPPWCGVRVLASWCSSIGVGRLRDGDGRHTLVGVSVEIPLFDRRQRPIARANAAADESRQRRRSVAVTA